MHTYIAHSSKKKNKPIITVYCHIIDDQQSNRLCFALEREYHRSHRKRFNVEYFDLQKRALQGRKCI